jgi:hypothetical protein
MKSTSTFSLHGQRWLTTTFEIGDSAAAVNAMAVQNVQIM